MSNEKSFEERYLDWCNGGRTLIRDLDANEFIRQADAKIAELIEKHKFYEKSSAEAIEGYQKRIKELETNINGLEWFLRNSDERISGLEAELLGAQVELDRARIAVDSQSPWTPASTPPRDDGRYLGIAKDDAGYYPQFWWCKDGSFDPLVVAWMPIPSYTPAAVGEGVDEEQGGEEK